MASASLDGRTRRAVPLAGSRHADHWFQAHPPGPQRDAEFLESIVDQTLALMNAGARLSDVISAVVIPRTWRTGHSSNPSTTSRSSSCTTSGASTRMVDGNPATLKPANDRASPRNSRALGVLVASPIERSHSCRAVRRGRASRRHLIEMAWLAAPEDPASPPRVNASLQIAPTATSTMAKAS